VLRRGAVLYQEAELLVREELREPRLYYSILRAVSEGCTRVSDITARVLPPAPRTDITPYLTTLQDLGLAEYRRPVVGGAVRRGTWQIADPYLRFWSRFVLPYKALLDHGADVERFYHHTVQQALDRFVSRPIFEDICRAWLIEQASTGVFGPVEQVGAWWGPVPAPSAQQPRRQAEAEIEIVAAQAGRVLVAGEAKWTREPVGFGVLNHLRDVLRYVPGADASTRPLLFARQFDPRLTAATKQEGVTLVRAADLYA
jgi:hypothetical protein